MSFEDKLLNGIPLAAASAYFCNIKVAGVAVRDRDLIEGCIKQAGMAMESLSPAAMGQHTAPPSLPPPGPAAMGKVSAFEDDGRASKKTYRQVGEDRGHASTALEFEREKHHHNEIKGDVVGRVGGALVGGTAGSRGKGSMRGLAAAGGAAVGQHVGGHVGRFIGMKADRKAWDDAAEKAAAFSLVFPTMAPKASGFFNRTKELIAGGRSMPVDAALRRAALEHGKETGKNVTFRDGLALIRAIARDPSIDKSLSNQAQEYLTERLKSNVVRVGGAGAGLGALGGATYWRTKKDTADLNRTFDETFEKEYAKARDGKSKVAFDSATQTYLANEQAAMQAEEAGQLEHLRARLQEASQIAASTGEQNAQLQQQVEQSGAQMQQLQQQTSDAVNQATMAADKVLQEQQAAAAIRMAYQQLRGQMLEIASVDPPSMSGMDAAQAAAQAANAQQGADPAQAMGPAGQAPEAQAAPNSIPASGVAANADQGGTPPGLNQTAMPTSLMGKTAATAFARAWNESMQKEANKEELRAAYAWAKQKAKEYTPTAKAFAKQHGPWVGAGALYGGASTYMSAKDEAGRDLLREKIEKLEAIPEKSRRQAFALAENRARLTMSEWEARNPLKATALGTLAGGEFGYAASHAIPAMISDHKELVSMLKRPKP